MIGRKIYRMSKIIIGIHGLGAKPAEKILKKWWKQSIREGLKSIGYPIRFFKFELVYWADFLHSQPLDARITDENHPAFLKEPYAQSRGIILKKPSNWRRKILKYLEKEIDKLFLNEDLSINFSSISDYIIRHFFSDLDKYYSGTCKDPKNMVRPVKDVLRENLALVLKKYRKKEILLIGHSMGSIISYDVLTQTSPDIPVDTLLTIGSPLGIPAIIGKTISELKIRNAPVKRLATPESVKRHWYNLSDLGDKVAFNYDLADDYKANSRRIKVTDLIVTNDYEYRGERNPHKVYGYLRTPECANIINEFLTRGRNKTIGRMMDKINYWIDNIQRF